MTSKNNSKVYAKSWATERFREFRDKYGRATDLIQDLLKLETEKLVGLLQNDQRGWESFKKCVKVLNNWIISYYWEDLHEKDKFWQNYLMYVYRMNLLKTDDIDAFIQKALDNGN